MADINIDGIVTWLKNWFYDKTEITGFLNNKANQSDLQTLQGTVTDLSTTVAGKAATNHASTSTTYGLGTTSNYGHVKTINGLTQSSHTNGTALSAYQGKVLKDLIDGLDTRISEISIDVIEVVSEQQWVSSLMNHPSANTMNKFFVVVGTQRDIFYTVRSGTSPNYTYAWESLDTDILDDLSIAWSDITNKPSSFTPSSHTHGNISNDGKITTRDYTVSQTNHPIVASSDGTLKQGLFMGDFLFDKSPHSNIGSSANEIQSNINTSIDTALGNKGAKTDDVDWTYNSNGFTNGVKLVDKTTNADGRITIHLKS